MKPKQTLRVLTSAFTAVLWAFQSPWTTAAAQQLPDSPVLAPGPEWAQSPQGVETLTLSELLALARTESPRLQAALFQVDATRTREDGAGLLPDPTLSVGLSNLALPEFSANMPASMAPSFQATQRFPLAGKRGLRAELARVSTAVDESVANEVWWGVRTEVAVAFYELYRVDRQTEVLERTRGLLEEFETVALSMYATGGGPQADVLRAGVTVARLDADLKGLAALRQGIGSRLNALVNRPAATPIPTPGLPTHPLVLPSHETLGNWARENRPALLGLESSIHKAEVNLDLAGKAIWPDLTLGVQYGLGRMNGDRRSMGGASLGFSLPIHAGSRQRKMEDEAGALEKMARAHLAEALASVDADVGRGLAELDRGRTLLSLYQDEILPQSRAAVESSLSSYRVGGVAFTDLIDAQMAVNRFEGEYIELLASYGSALAQMEKTIGRPLPTGDNPQQDTP